MARTRYVWDEQQQRLVEVASDWQPTTRTQLMTGSCYDGARATDGADISSRRKRNEYMRQRGLADADDFKGVWAKAAQEREAISTGQHDRAARREAIGRALHTLEKGSRR